MTDVPNPPSQDPSERSDTDHRIEEAKEIFRVARADKENARKIRRLRGEELPLFLAPFFNKLTSLIAGREDLVLPNPLPDIRPFLLLLDQGFLDLQKDGLSDEQQDPEDVAIQHLITYILTETKKLAPKKMELDPVSHVAASVKIAWETDYVGTTDELLRKAIASMYSQSLKKPYANFCPIIQGSGTGKSRLVDKLAESVFTIPVTLRPSRDTQGFPLGDTANGRSLVNFFCKPAHFTSALHAQLSYLQFLLKTLTIAGKWIDDYKESARAMENIAAEWRTYLGAARTTHRHDMYGQATDESALKDFEDILDNKVGFDTLQKRVQKFVRSITEKIRPGTDGEPAIIFYFDEAQHLTSFAVTNEDEEPRRTAYQCLCKAFTYMLGVPVFTLFLSTYSRLSEFSPSARNFWSSRPLSSTAKESDDNLNAPFVELPFDMWRESPIVNEGSHSGDEICSLKFMARFGRPMFWAVLEGQNAEETDMIEFAMSKLELRFEDPTRVRKDDYSFDDLIPLLAARVDFTFESNRDEAVFLEGLLVASSMRTVYSVPQHRQYLRGGYPSEPFLAEAAARSMLVHFRQRLEKVKSDPVQIFGTCWDEFKDDLSRLIAVYELTIPSAVSKWFQQGLIDKGPRGELVARLLFTLAHDISILVKLSPNKLDHSVSFSQIVPVVDFLEALIAKDHIKKVLNASPGNMEEKPLKEKFKNAYVHFTQFIKAKDESFMTDRAAYLLFTRGAAIQCHGNMADIDFVVPVWIRGDGNPHRWSMTAIFIQVKNRNAKQHIHIDVQNEHNFFTRGNSRPYIVIAMQLGLSDNLVNVSQSPSKKLRPRAKPQTHPRYEIFINGCSNQVYNVIGNAGDTYSALLAEKDILSEHPREGSFLTAVKRMKPYWDSESYDWAKALETADLEALFKQMGQPIEDEDGMPSNGGSEEGEAKNEAKSETEEEDEDEDGQDGGLETEVDQLPADLSKLHINT